MRSWSSEHNKRRELVQLALEYERVSLHLLLWCPMGLSGEASLVSLWFIMFLSDANASEDEVVPRQVKCGVPRGNAQLSPWSPLLVWGREGPTRLPSGCPARHPSSLSGLTLTTHGSPGLHCLLLLLWFPLLHGLLRLQVPLLCPLTPRPTDWARSPSFF